MRQGVLNSYRASVVFWLMVLLVVGVFATDYLISARPATAADEAAPAAAPAPAAPAAEPTADEAAADGGSSGDAGELPRVVLQCLGTCATL